MCRFARYALFITMLVVAAALSCTRKSELSAKKAQEHVRALVEATRTDVEEVRAGLPEGAKHLEALFKKPLTQEDAQDAKEELERARNQVQDLRVAKSTFFAVVTPEGLIVRNDREQDLMAGKNIFEPFPAVRTALEGKYVESQGSMPEASAVRGRPDAQWIAAQPVKLDGAVRGLYVTGWSWSAYAYRLENAVRSIVRSELAEREKMPLVYVFVVVDKDVYGAPVSPEVSARAIAALDPLAKIQGEQQHSEELEITGRWFGLAIQRTPALGANVAVAVLRSET
jgi:hypothetical protein